MKHLMKLLTHNFSYNMLQNSLSINDVQSSQSYLSYYHINWLINIT